MSAPLSVTQLAHLAALCQRSFNLDRAKARGRGINPDLSAPLARLDNYRQTHIAQACGRLDLDCCTQDDYKRAEAHFLDILGEPGFAMNALVKSESNPKRVADWKLRQACAEFGYDLAYAAAICRAQNHGAGLEDVGAKAIWCLVFTIRNRGSRRKLQEAA